MLTCTWAYRNTFFGIASSCSRSPANSKRGAFLNWSRAELVRLEKIRMFSNTKYVLVDLSGTLHIENEPTPDAPGSLQRYTNIML